MLGRDFIGHNPGLSRNNGALNVPLLAANIINAHMMICWREGGRDV